MHEVDWPKPEGEAVAATSGRAEGMGLPNPLESCQFHHEPQMLEPQMLGTERAAGFGISTVGFEVWV